MNKILSNIWFVIKFFTQYIGYHLFWFLPLKKNSFFFDSYYGRSFSCNPRYIYNELNRRGIVDSNSTCYITTRCDKDFELPKDCNIKYVNYLSLKYKIALMSAKVIIVNTDIPGYLPLRKKQLMINTWHGGGAYKKTGLDVDNSFCVRLATYFHSRQTTYFLSSSEKFSQAVQTGQGIPKSKIIPSGMPRNDGLVNKSYDMQGIKNKLNIDLNKVVVLYAPTYRNPDLMTDIKLDFELLSKSLEEKWKKRVQILFRDHYYFANNIKIDNIINVGDYPDMQELLYVSDILITDYSSSIWDFSLMSKPCFLFCPDKDLYNKNNGVYTDMSNWPGIVCLDNEELKDKILKFDYADYNKKISESHDYYGRYDNGIACEKVCDFIKTVI